MSSSSSSSAASESDDDFLIAKSTKNRTNKEHHAAESDEDHDEGLQINQKYAKEYTSRKRREELTNYRQLQALEGARSDDSEDPSDSESEDEDGELLTADVDVKIIHTLRALKRKDEGIYDRNVTFFDGDEGEDKVTSGRGEKVKPKRYKDVVREHILEEMEADEDGAADQLNNHGASRKADGLDGHDLAYDQEQREIRRAFLESTRDDDDDQSAKSESEEENWLKPKAKQSMSTKDDEQVKKLWEEEFTTSSNNSKLVDPKGEIADGDKFLMDFMTNRKWVDTSDLAQRNYNDDAESVESFQDKMDDFESKYNFRFEEAAAAGGEESGATHSIVHYARASVGDNVLRRKDESRRQKRLARKERKAEERKAKEEQLRRLKNAKREELEERMQQVRNVLGYDALHDECGEGKHALGAAEEEMILKLMEGDYDPEKFEQVMNAAYGEDYYQQEDEKWKNDQDVKGDLAKGVEDSDVLGDGDMYDDANDDGENEEAYPGENGEEVDEYYDEEDAQWESEQYAEESGMEKKLKSKMMDELYKLDYEDIIGDMPTRFKYRTVEANSYGLSTEEILLANDTTLKQFVSLKKMAPYRDEGEYQPGTKKRKRFRQMLKSDREEKAKLADDENKAAADGEEEGEVTKKKRRRQRKGKKSSGNQAEKDDADVGSNENAVLNTQNENVDDGASEKKHKKKKKASPTESSSSPENAEPESNNVSTENNKTESKKEKKRDKKAKNKHSHKSGGGKNKRKHSGVEGVSAARLASYGI